MSFLPPNGNIGIYPSKTDLILSRYRPIAPKPDQALTSSLTRLPESELVQRPAPLTSSSHEGFTQRSTNKRVGKRKRDSFFKPGAAGAARKKGAAATARTPTSGPARRSQMTSFDRGVGMDSCMRVVQCGALRSKVASESLITLSCLTDSTGMSTEDAGFMARAAANASMSILPDRKMKSGSFTEMIRGITGLSTAAEVHSLMDQSPRAAITIGALTRPSSGFIDISPPVRSVAAMQLGLRVSSCLQDGFELASPRSPRPVPMKTRFGKASPILSSPSCALPLIESGVDTFTLASMSPVAEADSVASLLTSSPSCATMNVEFIRERPGLNMDDDDLDEYNFTDKPVTLSLLPDGPVADVKCESLVSTSATTTGLTDHCIGSASMNVFRCDLAWLEDIYDSSLEPVTLIDDNRNVVWFNQAYKRAICKAMDVPLTLAPYQNPLGEPTELGRLHLLGDGLSSGTSATLCCFLEKRIADEREKSSGVSFFEMFSQSVCYGLTNASNLQHEECEANVGEGVTIVPRPVRLIGSSISLLSVNDIQLEAVSPLYENLEFLKRQHEVVTSPIVISDLNNMVKWVNTAYKQMIGQPECPWLMSLISDSAFNCEEGSNCEESQLRQLDRPTGAVLLCCLVEVPLMASAFAGRVNVQWTKEGEMSSMNLPCDVTRSKCSSSGGSVVLLVWRFDIQASLRLACTGV